MKPELELDVTDAAKADIAEILAVSDQLFGEGARLRYEALVATGLKALTEASRPLAATPRPELGDNVWSYHLRHCREQAARHSGKVAAPRHLLVYQTSPTLIRVIRVLHDAMDLRLHVPPETDPA